MGIPDHLTCLLRNLYANQEQKVTTLYGATDWFKIEKRLRQDCLPSPCLFNLYSEHIMRNPGLDELQAGIKIGRRNINSLGYVVDNTLTAESEEELKSLLMKVKEENERAGLNLNNTKTKIMASGPFASWQVEGEKVEVVRDFLFSASKSLRMVTAAIKSEDVCFLAEKL